jgi:DNA-binding NarL/FixJ family response regulator
MTGPLHITIAAHGEIIRRGIRSILEELAGNFAVTITEASEPEQLCAAVASKTPDILIAAPSFAPFLSPFSSPLSPPILPLLLPDRTKIVMLKISSDAGPKVEGRTWDEVITIGESAGRIKEKILRLAGVGRLIRRHGPLSRREKDIVVCVVKGMTNRQIAELLHLSHHTVGTHRRNISSKLDIHTVSGLTVYAISKNLIRLDELDRPEKPGKDRG